MKTGFRKARALAAASSMASVVVLAAPAVAQCTPEPTTTGGTTTCSGVDANGIAVTTSGTTLNVAAGATVTASNGPAVTINVPATYNASYDVVNVSGQVLGNGNGGIALNTGPATVPTYSAANLALTVASGGLVTGTNAIVLVQSSGNAYGRAVASVDNSGTLSGTSGIALSAGSPAFGSFTSIVNRLGGTTGAIAGQVGTLVNAGTIDGGTFSAVDTGPASNNQAFIGPPTLASTNSGTITSANAVATLAGGQPLRLTNAGVVRNTGSGAAISATLLTLANTGTITGNVVTTGPNSTFGTGSSIDSTGGTIGGNLSLGTSDDVLVARYGGTPTLITGIAGSIDGGGGTNSVRIKATQDTVIATALQLPTGFQRLQLAPAYGTTLTLANGFAAPGTITLFSDPSIGGGAIVNQAALTFGGQAFASQVYQGAASFTNQGSIRVTGGTTGTPALALDGVQIFTNAGLIDVVGDGVRTAINGASTNTGTIIATGTALTAFDNVFTNQGTVRSSGGTAVALSGNVGYRAVNSGTIAGAAVGVQTSIYLFNTGTIVATSPGGVAVALDAYGALINGTGGVVGNGNGSVAVAATIFNSAVVNGGLINGPVSLTGVGNAPGQTYVSLPGGVLNGDLTLGVGSLLVTDLVNTGPGRFAGINGSVTAGSGSALRYRVSSTAAAVLGPVGPFQTVSYELVGGAALSLTAVAPSSQTLQLAGTGSVSVNAGISTTSAPAIQSVSAITYPGSTSGTGSQLAITSAGSISLVRAANSYPAGAVVLGANDSFTNTGTINVVDRQSAGSFPGPAAAVSLGRSVTNGGTIQLDGAIGISGAASVLNTGIISEIAGGAASQGIVNGTTVDNRGTIAVTGPAVQLAYASGFGAQASVANSGTIASARGAAITSYSATSIDNRGTIAGGGSTAIQLGFGNDVVTLRTGSNVRGTIVGGGGTDTAFLAGSQATATGDQTVASFSGFSTLNVGSGYWTAAATGTSSFSRGLTIAAGATLEDANGANGLSGAIASVITNNGTFVVRSSAEAAGSTFGATRVVGAGDVLLTGAGTVLLDGANSLANLGTTTIANGTTTVLTGTQAGTLVTAPGGVFQIGRGAVTGSFTGNLTDNGTLILNRADDFVLPGALGGSGVLNKLGANIVTLAGTVGFTGILNIQAGSIKLATSAAATSQLNLEGSGRLDLSGLTQTVAALSGGSSAASINIAGGALTVNQAGDTSFAGSIIGSGSFVKAGAGRLVLTGAETYSGPTTVSAGTLSVNGSMASPITVASGAVLGGTGALGTVTIAAGGTYAPGNSIGTQALRGDLTFAPTATYQVEANAAGQADRVDVAGRATLAGTVAVLPAPGGYANLTNYTILTASGGINGVFAGATSSLAFLSPYLSYGANAVTLSLVRNDVSFASAASSPNGARVAAVVQARGFGDPLFNGVLVQTSDAAARSFDSLSGEIHASLPTALLLEGEALRLAILDHASDGDGRPSIWGQGLYGRIETSGPPGIGNLNDNVRGGIGGFEFGRDGFRFGLAGGYTESRMTLGTRSASANVATKIAGGYAGWHRGQVRLTGGVTYSWHVVDTRRVAAIGATASAETARYHATTGQVFGKAGYALRLGAATIAPFAGFTHLWNDRDRLNERGNLAALSAAARSRAVDLAMAGIDFTGVVPLGGEASLLPHLSAAYERGWGNLVGTDAATFGGAGPAFAVAGASTGRDTLRIQLGADVAVGRSLRLGVAGYGAASSPVGRYGAQASARYIF